jgi:hypothetical protein
VTWIVWAGAGLAVGVVVGIAGTMALAARFIGTAHLNGDIIVRGDPDYPTHPTDPTG